MKAEQVNNRRENKPQTSDRHIPGSLELIRTPLCHAVAAFPPSPQRDEGELWPCDQFCWQTDGRCHGNNDVPLQPRRSAANDFENITPNRPGARPGGRLNLAGGQSTPAGQRRGRPGAGRRPCWQLCVPRTCVAAAAGRYRQPAEVNAQFSAPAWGPRMTNKELRPGPDPVRPTGLGCPRRCQFPTSIISMLTADELNGMRTYSEH